MKFCIIACANGLLQVKTQFLFCKHFQSISRFPSYADMVAVSFCERAMTLVANTATAAAVLAASCDVKHVGISRSVQCTLCVYGKRYAALTVRF